MTGRLPVTLPPLPGELGSAEVANARPDGQTLLIAASGAVLLGSMFKDAPVDIFESFETVAQVGDLVYEWNRDVGRRKQPPLSLTAPPMSNV